MNKYKNSEIVVDGIFFQSKAEGNYYMQLKWLKDLKQIKSFEVQPKFLLQESFKKNGKTFRKIEYTADFKIINLDDSIEVIDIKGFVTPTFSIKQKLFEKRYPHKLTLLTHVKKYGGWIELDEYKKLKRAEKRKKGDAKQ